FEIPIQTNGTDDKAAYGIYTMSGRSLYLNSIYIYSRNDTLNLTLDKQVYDPGDTVNVTVESIVYGDSVLLTSRIYFTAGEEIIDTISIDSCLTHFFLNVPPHVVASTYNLEYILHVNDTQYLVGERPFDIDGIIGYFLESNLDTNTYSPCDTATLMLFIHVNMSFNGRLKGWLRSLGKDMPLVFDTAFALIDTLPNQIEVAFPMNLEIQGCAQVVYTLFWDSLPICGGSESFDIFIDDSLPPSIQLIKLPEAGYVSNMPYEVTTVIQDDNPFYDTLYYYIDFLGWTYTEGYNCLGDTFVFSIPPQPNGTEVEYYIAVIDTFGNRTREPTVHNYSFWIHKPLAPNNISISPLETTAVNINWEHPVEEINYDLGTPLESYLLPPGEIAAVRFTPQYYPCHIKNVKLYIQISTGKNVTKFSLNDSERDYEIQVYVFEVDSFGEPGNLLMGPYSAVIDGGCGWKIVNLDSLNLALENGEFYLGIASSNQQAQIYGDANQTGIMRSRFYDGETWQVDSTIGNILIRAKVEYIPASGKSNSNLIGYQLFRRHQDDSSFVVIRDTITVNTVIDTNLVEETQYFYKINAVYNQPDRIVGSDEENLWTDWSSPIFENVEISETSDTSIVIEAEITDWSGIFWDSLYYRSEEESLFTGKTHDIVDSIYYYTVPYQPEDSLFYWLCAVDSSLWLNYTRFPDSGYAFYYSPSTGIEENIPRVFFLSQNFPNPFRQKTVISYQLPVISKVSLKVYDITGRLVITLVDEEKEAGYYKVKWSGKEKNLTSGIYFVRLHAGTFIKTRKMILIR
ncbi:T9SS type A sorting domain-containing protein, partial [candidate division WOR-3 bacterium]|nr:T9SS type A sorting domain-containing protein [candidate division WOR-3 bacterium]